MDKTIFFTKNRMIIAAKRNLSLPFLQKYTIAACSFLLLYCADAQQLRVGAEQMGEYLPLLTNRKVALVVNQTSVIGKTHLVDSLLSRGVQIKAIFAPEHGFRGEADAGEVVQDGKDLKTGLPLISLYGKNKKPSTAQLNGVDCVVFDIQDVGVRFYTYISTMHYVMEACAENKIPFLVLDRPNPNGHYVDGPVLKKAYQSFVGMHPIPVVHGLTVGELAGMINGEGWLKEKGKCELTVIPVLNWQRQQAYDLPVKPSPNLPNKVAINLYPSLCFFEATAISVGRGTLFPFQVLGSTHAIDTFVFTPISIPGMSKHPKHQGKTCYGLDLRREERLSQIKLDYLISFYLKFPAQESFFTNPRFFNLLAGNDELQQQIKAGVPAENIRHSWQKDLQIFLKKREKYLIYR